MRTKHRVILLSLVLSAILSSVLTLTSTAFATSKEITFANPTMVGNVVLKPGVYHVVWTGTGPVVEVSFIKGGKTVATAPARLVLEKSSDRKIEMSNLPDDTRVLKRLVFSSKVLIFDSSGVPDAS
ncbi:MAG: hypothetical protein ACJ74G_09340 [Blastocatellia bacterium]